MISIMLGLYGTNYASRLNELAIYQNYRAHPEAFINAYNQKVSSQIQGQLPSITPAQMPRVQVLSAPVELALPAQGFYDPNVMERELIMILNKKHQEVPEDGGTRDT